MMRKNGFLCYAYRDGQSPSRQFVEELQLHLNVIELSHEHKAWCDQDLKPGDDWRNEIHNALDSAAYAVLFINVEFLNSRFITEVELPKLLDAARRDGLLLLPLLVGDCPLPDWLTRIQFLERCDRPLSAVRKPTRDRIFTAVAERVQEFLNDGGQTSQAARLMNPVVPTLAHTAPAGHLG